QDQLLNTITSRTQLVKIPALSAGDIRDHLLQTMDITENKATEAAYLSDGNLQTALNFLREGNNDNFRLFSSWMRMTFSDRGAQILEFVDEVSKIGRESQKSLLRYGISLLRESVMILSD